MRRVRVIRKVGVLDLRYLRILLDCGVDDGAELELHLVLLEKDLVVDIKVVGVDLFLPNLLGEVPNGVRLVLLLLLLLVHVSLVLFDRRVADLLLVIL